MSEEIKETADSPAHGDNGTTISLEGMYQEWFLTYASYTIMDRAIPTLKDGLKPVQRRILHSMRELEDGPDCTGIQKTPSRSKTPGAK